MPHLINNWWPEYKQLHRHFLKKFTDSHFHLEGKIQDTKSWCLLPHTLSALWNGVKKRCFEDRGSQKGKAVHHTSNQGEAKEKDARLNSTGEMPARQRETPGQWHFAFKYDTALPL